MFSPCLSLQINYSESTLLLTTWNRDKKSDQNSNFYLDQLENLIVKLGFIIIERRVHGI